MQEFVEWYSRLAQSGETCLIVRQKPLLQDGEPQYHKDGAIKCTWPAMLPSKWKPNLPLYGNTGLFIIDRFKDGKPSASAANVEFCGCMVLDDIGTKSQVPPLPPTWRIETSPGSEQWGYVFSEQPTKGDFSAAIIAIAEAGYTDRGAINPVRNFRLPGSINIKPGRDNFAARLLEWHKDREFTLEQICAALDVVPGEADTAHHKAVQLVDDGTDEVAAWLSAQGMVLERPNGSGWMGVVCPNAAEHTDGNPMGRYNPVHRAYSCLHSHCHDWSSSRYMAWVADQGGPAVQVGTREELVTDTMAGVMERLKAARSEGSQFSAASEADAIIAAVERAELGRLERDEWFNRFAYIQDEDAYFDMQRRKLVTRAAFNALYRHLDTRSIHGKKPRVVASLSYDELRQSSGAKVLDTLTYAAGEGEIVASADGQLYGNRWFNARPVAAGGAVVDEAAVAPWLELWARIIPDAAERKHILDVLAYKVQYPQTKINHALLIAGGHGIGKDTALAPFLWAVGGQHLSNVSIVKNDDLTSRWGYALEAEVMLINELRQTEAKDRRALENTLKPIIAAPPDRLPIERKGMHPYYALNRILVIAYSNERAAIALPTEDRRWFVVWSSAERLPDIVASNLWKWYANGGMRLISSYMLSRDVSRFDPAAPPPMTEAKQALIAGSRSGAEEYILDMIENRTGPFLSGVCSPVYSLIDRVKLGYGGNPAGINKMTIIHSLKEAGWRDLGMCYSRDFPTKKHLFCAPELATSSKSELRRLVEPGQETTPLLQAVK